MVETISVDIIFIIIIFIIGGIITYFGFSNDSLLDSSNCNSATLKKANKGVLVIGVILIVASISFLTCYNKCNRYSGFSTFGYMIFIFITGLVLTILGYIIASESEKFSCQIINKNIWLIGILISALTGGYLFKKYIDSTN